MLIKSGNRAPDVTLTTVEGQAISLAETWRTGQNVVLVFLRHLG